MAQSHRRFGVTAIADPVDPRSADGGSGVGTAYGTFGELLQGALPGPGEPDGEGRFLVTLPIARWSTARFELRGSCGIAVSPDHKTKSATLATALLTELGYPAHGRLVLHSSIPEGKGLASSSADLVATARAVLAAVKRSISTRRIGAMLAAIEPTDGVMHQGIVAFDHRRGIHLRTLGRLPALQVVAADQGGCVDTVAFNRTATGYTAAERRQYAQLLNALAVAVARTDLAAVGAISTRSAALNQDRLPSRNFAGMRRICRDVGGLGLVACHSGTMVGILLDPRDAEYRSRLSHAVQLAEELPGRTHLYRTLAA